MEDRLVRRLSWNASNKSCLKVSTVMLVDTSLGDLFGWSEVRELLFCVDDSGIHSADRHKSAYTMLPGKCEKERSAVSGTDPHEIALRGLGACV